MAFFTLVQGSVFVTSATNLPSSTPIQILEKGVQGPMGASGAVNVTNPVDLRTFPLAAALTTGMYAYVTSRFIPFILFQSYATADDGTDVILASDGVRKWVSTSIIPLQPGGVSGYLMKANGPGVNPTWVAPTPFGTITTVATPATLGTTPVSADLSDGMIVYVLSRKLHYKFDASSGAAADGTDIIVGSSGGAGRWLSTAAVQLQPGGTAALVLTSNGPGVNPTWTAPAGGPPTGAAGGDLAGTYPNPTVKSLTGTAGSLPVATTASVFSWAVGSIPVLQLNPIGAGVGTPFSILGQTTVGAAGGDITLTPGGGTPSGQIHFDSPTLGNLLHWDSSTARLNWSASATSAGSGQDTATVGGGVNRVERTQAAFPTGNSAGGVFSFVVGKNDGAGGLSSFRFGRETTVASTFFDSLDVLPGATQAADLSIRKYGNAGAFNIGFVTTLAAAAGGAVTVAAQGGGAGVGGAVTLTSGLGTGANAGPVTLQGGSASGASAAGGAIDLVAGNTVGAAGVGGTISVLAGSSLIAGNGGAVNVFAGASSGAAGANVSMRPGSGTTDGNVVIQSSGGAAKLTYSGSANRILAGVPVAGDSTLGNPSFRFGYLDINLGGAVALTLSAAQAANPVIQFTNAGGPFTITFPNDIGAVWYIMNRAGNTMTTRTVAAAGSVPNTLGNTNLSTFVVYSVAGVATIQKAV